MSGGRTKPPRQRQPPHTAAAAAAAVASMPFFAVVNSNGKGYAVLPLPSSWPIYLTIAVVLAVSTFKVFQKKSSSKGTVMIL
jgi:hypothetical protein